MTRRNRLILFVIIGVLVVGLIAVTGSPRDSSARSFLKALFRELF